VRDVSGKTSNFATVSPQTYALSQQLKFQRLHVAPQWVERVASALARASE